VGLVVGVALAVRRGRLVSIDTGETLDLTFYAILVGLVGARLLYVLMHAGEYARLCAGNGLPRSLGQKLGDCSAPLQFWQGGLVFLGGAVLAASVVLLYARRRRLPLGNVADVLVPSVSIAHVFGRLGCFMVGCCYGKPTGEPWGVTFTNPLAHQWVGTPLGVKLHPTELYEMVAEIINFLVLYWLVRHKKFEGQVIGLYMILYGIARFFIEFFRGDPGRGDVFGGFMSGTQLIALLMVAAGGILWVVRFSLQPPPEVKPSSGKRSTRPATATASR